MKKMDRAALGGMRSPASSLARVPGSCVAGDKIRDTLDRVIASHETLRNPAQRILAGLPTPGFSTQEVARARAAVWKALQITHRPVATGLQPHLIEKYGDLSGDPDTDLAPWLLNGAPLGAYRPVTSRGVFPVDHRCTEDPLGLPQAWRGDWLNYSSAEDEPDRVEAMLDALVSADKAVSYDLDKGEEPEGLVVASKLGLLSKPKPDGSMKYGLVWDFRRSGVSGTVSQG